MAHDQHGNGSRPVDVRVGESLGIERYTPRAAVPILHRLPRDRPIRARCAERGALLRSENALSGAASALLQVNG
jgi:hypothetical protein